MLELIVDNDVGAFTALARGVIQLITAMGAGRNKQVELDGKAPFS